MLREKHGGGDNVLAGSIEDWGFTRLVLIDAAIDLASSFSSPSAMHAYRTLPLKGLL
jgi:hypothetical protein